MASPNFDFPEGSSPPRPSSRRLVTYGKANVRRAQKEPVSRPKSSSSAQILQPPASEPVRPSVTNAKAPQKSLVKPTSWGFSTPKSATPHTNGSPKTSTRKEVDEEDSQRKRTYTEAFVAKRQAKPTPSASQRLATVGSQSSNTPKQVKRGVPLLKADQPSLSSRSAAAVSQDHSTVSPSKRPIVRLSRSPSPTSRPSETARVPSRPKDIDTPARSRRPRLIDALVAQRVASPDLESSDSDSDVFDPNPHKTQNQDITITQFSNPAISRDVRPGQRLGDASNRKKVKFTYSQARTIKDDPQPSEPSLSLAASDMDTEALLPDSLAMPSPGAFDFDDDDDDDDTSTKVAIKSVHELRRAGANNRFADEMEDLLSRIGQPANTPSTMRRNALFDLAQRLQRADFVSNFRDHGTRDSAFNQVGREKDVIAGFALTASLVTFLMSGSAPHLLQQLTDEGIGRTLGRLLRIEDDIDTIASQKQSNLTKSSRATVHMIREALRTRDIWHGHAVETIPPRLLALQLLDVLIKSADARSVAMITKESDEGLFVVANDFVNADVEESAELALIASILEAQSSLSAAVEEAISDTSKWSLPIASFLEKTLARWPEATSDTGTTVLKLAINTTNTSGGAMAFNRRGLLSQLSRCVCSGFSRVQRDVTSGSIDADLYNHLLLTLGVGINIFEHCPAARTSVDEASQAILVELYTKNNAAMSEADSEEKSKLSVGFGYLSVLLGYLCLGAPVRKRFQSGDRGLRDLIKSIQEFITMFKHAGNKASELEALVTNLRTGSWAL